MSSEPAKRCARHPGRVAADHCPVCDRARCLDDAAQYAGSGCAVCRTAGQDARPPASTLQVLIGAGLAGMPAVYLGGMIASEYVRTHIFALVVPALVGVGACWPALVVCHRSRRGATAIRRLTLAVSGVAACCGLLGTALGFRLDPGGPPQIIHPWSLVGLPYVVSAAAAVLWPYAYGGPKLRDSQA